MDRNTAVCVQTYVHAGEEFVKKISDIPELAALLEACETFRAWQNGEVSVGRLLYELEAKFQSKFLSKTQVWQQSVKPPDGMS